MLLAFKMSACCLSVQWSRPLNIFLLPPSGSCAQSVFMCLGKEVRVSMVKCTLPPSLSLSAANPKTVRDTASATGGTGRLQILGFKARVCLETSAFRFSMWLFGSYLISHGTNEMERFHRLNKVYKEWMERHSHRFAVVSEMKEERECIFCARNENVPAAVSWSLGVVCRPQIRHLLSALIRMRSVF